ncbi:MAG: radical SAM protein [Thermoanaerobaculia bacterium]
MQKKSAPIKFLVTETFISLQGEGPFSGFPCFFIRLSGCPHNCIYCDTKYAKLEGEEKDLKELLKEAKDSGINLIEVTGGEPLSQEGTPLLLKELLKLKFKVLLETSGYESIAEVPENVIKILDFKTPGSQAPEFNLENLNFLKRWDALKFVIIDRDDFFWAKEKVEKLKLPEICNVYFSPAYPYFSPIVLANLILKYKLPVFLNLPLHKLLWGEERKR